MGNRVPITEEQKKLSYAKYFYKELAPVPEESIRIAEAGPIDPSKALRVHDRNRLFEPGYLDTEIGYCVMEDGTGFVANLTKMPGVTTEMFDWWFAWHGLGELRYCIWDPEDHYSARSLDPAIGRCQTLSMKERYWNTTHVIVEDIGMGPQNIHASFRNPKEMGFDSEKIGTEACGTIVTSIAGDDSMSQLMCHFMRNTEEGTELRTRFWLGWDVVDGKAVKTLPDHESIPEEACHKLLLHNIKEFSNLASFLADIYAEEKDNW
ncbi:hypothetical protein CXIVA_10480 [Clostridium sp. SY8519]|uniref:DAPG hydrolase family protein n=1 Tax=Clostridium sp. (strain SY8519) TaxID=1042156 RepID=UPI0002171B46|nr:hypothetical protein [Clostridium sp. SY8519]BAK47015.1 hypothetical protein CXIVA_10480 [Clostridium sp. SY8519]